MRCSTPLDCFYLYRDVPALRLNYDTLDLATSVGDIQTQQALYKLSLILNDPAALPARR